MALLKTKRTKLKFDLSKLSKTEKRYFKIMISGTPCYIRGVPGNAKSAIGRSICDKVIWWYQDTPEEKSVGLNYIDLRLSDKDETDLGSYPVTKNPIEQLLRFTELFEKGYLNIDDFNKIKDKYVKVILSCDDVTSLSFAVPDWALEANVRPTVIHVEELNRCDSRVRNAALQLLNEKQIGNFKFNSNVFWMASGNLGETDRTEVDEMDLALSNRLCILDHDLTVIEWAENFGYENCWNMMVDYLIANPVQFSNVKPAPDEVRYATPRSWTNLSNYILINYGDDPDPKEVSDSEEMAIVGLGFVGSSWHGFARYLTETSKISINDIVNRWDDVKSEVKNLNRARTMELMSNLRTCGTNGSYTFLQDKNKEQITNIISFLKVLSPDKDDNNKSTKAHSNDDEVTSYILFLVDKMDPANERYHKYVIKFFADKAKIIHKWVDSGRHKKADGTPDLTGLND